MTDIKELSSRAKEVVEALRTQSNNEQGDDSSPQIWRTTSPRHHDGAVAWQAGVHDTGRVFEGTNWGDRLLATRPVLQGRADTDYPPFITALANEHEAPRVGNVYQFPPLVSAIEKSRNLWHSLKCYKDILAKNNPERLRVVSGGAMLPVWEGLKEAEADVVILEASDALTSCGRVYQESHSSSGAN